MATTVPLGVITDVTLGAAEAVETITGAGSADWLILWPIDGGQVVDVYVITKSGGTANADGRFVAATTIDGGWQFDISPFGFLGLAGSAAGSVRVELR